MSDNDEVSIESDDPEADLKADKKVVKLKTEIEQLRQEKQEYLDGWQRAKADYVNALKRFEADVATARVGGQARAVEAFLPAFDALERAKEHLSAQAGGELPKGFDAIVKQLESALKQLGVENVGEVGEVFDPALHEALGQDSPDSPEKDGTITAVLEKGYRVQGFVIRVAKVRVAHHA